eukprot:CAMPEP_0178694660 /NCGR_PEP_ID=MMETSP0699-20121125/8376_1 /TAXON_ID=265572 /ORGANISM="Extubocellulus spinifer, Strain CCMP396" /LENGTH=44 /DNA_ID= /DNA_START= /DNA_END= /DNA_ORIENTATION=
MIAVVLIAPLTPPGAIRGGPLSQTWPTPPLHGGGAATRRDQRPG